MSASISSWSFWWLLLILLLYRTITTILYYPISTSHRITIADYSSPVITFSCVTQVSSIRHLHKYHYVGCCLYAIYLFACFSQAILWCANFCFRTQGLWLAAYISVSELLIHFLFILLHYLCDCLSFQYYICSSFSLQCTIFTIILVCGWFSIYCNMYYIDATIWTLLLVLLLQIVRSIGFLSIMLGPNSLLFNALLLPYCP